MPKRLFRTIIGIDDLGDQRFGPVPIDIGIPLDAQLSEGAGDVCSEVARLCTRDFSWDRSVELAQMIEGYALIERSGRGSGSGLAWGDARLNEARTAGRRTGTPPELCASLFLEHRRWWMSGPFEPEAEMKTLLDTLRQQLRYSLIEAGYLSA